MHTARMRTSALWDNSVVHGLQRAAAGHPLHDTATTRKIESAALNSNPATSLMERAGIRLAQLGRAIAPHAKKVWIACGAGNNGGDGLQAAAAFQTAGFATHVHWLGDPQHCSTDSRVAWLAAQQAGVRFLDCAPPMLDAQDLAVDALLGIGANPRSASNPHTSLMQLLQRLHQCQAPVLCADLPSGLQADTGQYLPGFAFECAPHSPRHTLSLLTLKPGLFTGAGRDAAGDVWWDDLETAPFLHSAYQPCARLGGAIAQPARTHASHKGSFGDVAVIGGEGLHLRGMGMGGAAVLAATAALHHGAGRVMLALLDEGHCQLLPQQPELMLRQVDALRWDQGVVVCGCGGGQAIAAILPQVLEQTHRLVLDADALNAIAASTTLQQLLARRTPAGRQTILTPHPLEAARLLGSDTTSVQADRLHATHILAQQTLCTVVLKGSGSVITTPHRLPTINSSGNALLATAGTGDVLAGMIGAAWAQGLSAHDAACAAVWHHGQLADQWPRTRALTANALARASSWDPTA